VREFRVDDCGAPRYPEVVLMTARKTLAQRRDTLRRALRAIDEGLRDTLARPDAAARQIAAAAETRDVGLTRAQLDAVSRAFAPGLGSTGTCSSSGPTSMPASGSSSAAPTCAGRLTSASPAASRTGPP
jgi:hypothetical protein